MTLCKKCEDRLWRKYVKRVVAMSGSRRSGLWGKVVEWYYRFRIRHGWCRCKHEEGSS